VQAVDELLSKLDEYVGFVDLVSIGCLFSYQSMCACHLSCIGCRVGSVPLFKFPVRFSYCGKTAVSVWFSIIFELLA